MNVDQLVQDFAGRLAALLQREMREAVNAANATTRTPKNAFPTKAATAKASTIARREPSQKRTLAEMAALKVRLLRLIEDNPGKRTEDLNATLGTNTSDLALPLRQLVAAKLVKTEGQRRGTKYFPGKQDKR